MNVGLGISTQLQQKLSFQMIHGLKILQVNTLQLEQMIRAELEQNPLLEVEEYADLDMDLGMEAEEGFDGSDGGDDDYGGGGDDQYLEEIKGGEEGIDWEEYLEEGFDLGYSRSEGGGDPGEERYEASPVYEKTLEEHLSGQLAERKNLEERVTLLVQFLISNLDEDGYLRIPLADLAGYAEVAVSEVEDALGVLHKFTPAGVGARDLRECMVLQLRARKMEDSLAMAIVSRHWGLLEKHRIPEIARLQNVQPRQVQEAIDCIKTLTPKPGYQFSADRSSAVTPDLVVKKVDGKYVVLLNDHSLPTLCISKSYADMIRRGSKAQKEVKEYVREKFNNASWFIRAIEQRRGTMLKVMGAIVERQKPFFEKGPLSLVPLKQQDIAAAIEMHLSTVSRVTTGKYVQTQHGIFELKYFFSEAAGEKQRKKTKPEESDADGTEDAGIEDSVMTETDAAADTGADVTTERIKNRIRILIEEEDPRNPITDRKISEVLAEENLPAARRTVAKYREQMRIPTTRQRQKYE